MGLYPINKGGKCLHPFYFIPFLTASASIVKGTIKETDFLLIYCDGTGGIRAVKFFQ